MKREVSVITMKVVTIETRLSSDKGQQDLTLSHIAPQIHRNNSYFRSDAESSVSSFASRLIT